MREDFKVTNDDMTRAGQGRAQRRKLKRSTFDDELDPTAECVRSKLGETRQPKEQWGTYRRFSVKHVGP